jgi:hypothetical protein
MLLALLLAAADPAPATAVSDAAYVADCQTYSTAADCRCVADRLQQSNDGRLMLELTTARAASASQTDEQIAVGLAVIRGRYGIAPGAPLGPRLDAVVDPAVAACEATPAQ